MPFQIALSRGYGSYGRAKPKESTVANKMKQAWNACPKSKFKSGKARLSCVKQKLKSKSFGGHHKKRRKSRR